MNSINRVTLIGNLTRDPEVRQTSKGKSVTDLGVALNRTYTTDSGEQTEEVTYVDVVLWGRQAETAGNFLHKGRRIYIEGRLQLDSWQDRETGKPRQRLRVVGENVLFLDSTVSSDRRPDTPERGNGRRGQGRIAGNRR